MAWRPLLDVLFPPQCANCNALGAGLCDSCTPRGQTICVRFPSLAVTAFAPYEGSLRTAILALKDGRRDVAEALGRSVAPLLEPGSLVIPIPTTAKRRVHACWLPWSSDPAMHSAGVREGSGSKPMGDSPAMRPPLQHGA